MKVALLISGYLRTFSTNLPNLKKQILDKFETVDVYIHITKNSDKEDKYLNFNYDIDYINEVLNPVCLLCEDNHHLSNNKTINNTLNTWFKFYKLNEIKKENEEVKGKYDLVIKYRPDLNISSEEVFTGDISEDILFIPLDSKIDKDKLANKDDKYICDIFAYGNSKMMDFYFQIYEKLDFLITDYNTSISETLLYHYLNILDIPYRLVNIDYSVILSQCNVFAIAGDSGSGKTTLGNILQKYFSSSFMLECDRYHKWERKDENWQKYTHLNPEANYLTKMNEDIFDLKVGKAIYQVDYDHSTGKFTQPEKIDSSDNIIVCGLHSLYNDDESVYNIKLFIDTDETLKYTWKIKRDMAKRGYTKEAILAQIESRKEDYINYILPQRDNSDIIINFFTDTKFDINNIQDNLDIKLRIILNMDYLKRNNSDLAELFYKLEENNIEYSLVYGKNRNNSVEIIFEKYKENNLLKGFQNGNYYDYILFIILNLSN